jgi:hypothetical protein
VAAAAPASRLARARVSCASDRPASAAAHLVRGRVRGRVRVRVRDRVRGRVRGRVRVRVGVGVGVKFRVQG